jgi:hypothetical protein
MAGNGYVLREHPDYTEQLGQIATAEQLELRHFRKALNITFHVLGRDPTTYPVVETGAAVEIRIAKTEVYIDDGIVVPPLQIYYVIWEDEQVVELINIEKRRGFGLL